MKELRRSQLSSDRPHSYLSTPIFSNPTLAPKGLLSSTKTPATNSSRHLAVSLSLVSHAQVTLISELLPLCHCCVAAVAGSATAAASPKKVTGATIVPSLNLTPPLSCRRAAPAGRRTQLPVVLQQGRMHKRQEARGGSSVPPEDSKEPKMDIKSILKDIEFLGSSHMTWKQKKDLENKKVVSLGGKPPKKQRLPLSVARVTMKKQKEREEKMLKEREILGRFGAYSSNSLKKMEKRRPQDRVLKATEGNFRNGVLDVKHLLQPSGPRIAGDNGGHAMGGGKKKKGGRKGQGKKNGSGRKRH